MYIYIYGYSKPTREPTSRAYFEYPSEFRRDLIFVCAILARALRRIAETALLKLLGVTLLRCFDFKSRSIYTSDRNDLNIIGAYQLLISE